LKPHRNRLCIDKLQDRGRFFVDPFEDIYEGQIVGENTRDNDLGVNNVKAKQLTNFRTTAKGRCQYDLHRP
jgi:GTP-binding protein